MIIFHDPRCAEYSRSGPVERPERVARTVPFLQERHPEWEWRLPGVPDNAALLRAHSAKHIDAIRAAACDFDDDCPAYADVFHHALRGSGAALDVARTAMRGELTFSLMR